MSGPSRSPQIWDPAAERSKRAGTIIGTLNPRCTPDAPGTEIEGHVSISQPLLL